MSRAVITGVGVVRPSLVDYGRPQERDTRALLAPSLAHLHVSARVGAAPPLERQIPRAADRRAMGVQFQYGVYAAGQALDDAGLGAPDQRADVALFVATRQGERDEAVDAAIFALADERNLERAINETLMAALRPTLFLAQIPNLLAGNVAIVHSVCGESRTFLGEEEAGINAVGAAIRAVEHGRARAVLAGGALNAARESLLRWREADGTRAAMGELATAAAFLVIETEAGALARGRAPVAAIRSCGSALVAHAGAGYGEFARAAWCAAAAADAWVLTNAAAGSPRAVAEARAWADAPPAHVVSFADLVGSTLEADLPGQAALAAQLVSGVASLGERPPPRRVLVLTAGPERGAGAVVVETWNG